MSGQVLKMVRCKCRQTCNVHKPRLDEDLISNLPEIAIDKILKCLPVKTVAQMSILSKKWRHIWLSAKHLIFDERFWEELEEAEGNYDSDTVVSKCNSVISNILFHHIGPIYEFHLNLDNYDDNLYLNGWISLLSKIGVKKIALMVKSEDYVPMPPSFFNCKDLVKFEVEGSILSRIPSHFKGFPYLRSLDLAEVEFEDDVFANLISICPRLTVLKLMRWVGMDDGVVIDVPSLQHLTICGYFENIVLRNVRNLSFMSLYLENEFVFTQGVTFSIDMLASLCQLQELHVGGRLCKYFDVGQITLPNTVEFLQTLHIKDVDLSDYDEFCFTLNMLQCCPLIKDLHISVDRQNSKVENESSYKKRCELKHLVNVEITNLRGSILELKLIEYLLFMATNLEKLSFKCSDKLNARSQLKVAHQLLGLPRVSPKAKLDCL